jgi:hypothetical protein
MVTAQQWAQSWANGMSGADAKIRAGVMATVLSPGQEALGSIAKMRANWIAAIDSGRWAIAMGAMTVQEWQQAMIQKGLPRIADGVAAGKPKVQAYANIAIPVMQALQAQIHAMPKTTPAESEARVLAWMRGMRNAKAQLRGGQ